MKPAVDEQLELISPELPLSRTMLMADSPKKAFYMVSVYQLTGSGSGFVVRKTSGPQGKRGITELFWRPSFKTAMLKKSGLLEAKTKKTKGRIYFEVLEDKSHEQI